MHFSERGRRGRGWVFSFSHENVLWVDCSIFIFPRKLLLSFSMFWCKNWKIRVWDLFVFVFYSFIIMFFPSPCQAGTFPQFILLYSTIFLPCTSGFGSLVQNLAASGRGSRLSRLFLACHWTGSVRQTLTRDSGDLCLAHRSPPVTRLRLASPTCRWSHPRSSNVYGCIYFWSRLVVVIFFMKQIAFDFC